jgi:hypothetical protein
MATIQKRSSPLGKESAAERQCPAELGTLSGTARPLISTRAFKRSTTRRGHEERIGGGAPRKELADHRVGAPARRSQAATTNWSAAVLRPQDRKLECELRELAMRIDHAIREKMEPTVRCFDDFVPFVLKRQVSRISKQRRIGMRKQRRQITVQIS